jgi:hypothetical protein
VARNNLLPTGMDFLPPEMHFWWQEKYFWWQEMHFCRTHSVYGPHYRKSANAQAMVNFLWQEMFFLSPGMDFWPPEMHSGKLDPWNVDPKMFSFLAEGVAFLALNSSFLWQGMLVARARILVTKDALLVARKLFPAPRNVFQAPANVEMHGSPSRRKTLLMARYEFLRLAARSAYLATRNEVLVARNAEMHCLLQEMHFSLCAKQILATSRAFLVPRNAFIVFVGGAEGNSVGANIKYQYILVPLTPIPVRGGVFGWCTALWDRRFMIQT